MEPTGAWAAMYRRVLVGQETAEALPRQLRARALLTLSARGMTIGEIAQRVRLTEYTVARILKENGAS